jgi:transglycosylase-like protein with SLT domain
MQRIVTPISACVVLTLTAAPALARSHSHHHHHHRHAVTAKHFSHHHFARHAHARHWHHRRYVVQQPFAAPFGANPFGWQQTAAQPAPFVAQAPVRRQRVIAQPAPFGWQQQTAPEAPFGWQQQAVAVSPRRHFAAARDAATQSQFASLVSAHARANGIPESLVHRVIMRESRYNPRAVSKGNYGIMQIRLGTARAMGYTGSAAGLLDANTNMIYAVRYLAGAYRAAGGNQNRAVGYYASGYYGAAKRAGFSAYAMARPAVARYGAPAYSAPTYGAGFRAETF